MEACIIRIKAYRFSTRGDRFGWHEPVEGQRVIKTSCRFIRPILGGSVNETLFVYEVVDGSVFTRGTNHLYARQMRLLLQQMLETDVAPNTGIIHCIGMAIARVKETTLMLLH